MKIEAVSACPARSGRLASDDSNDRAARARPMLPPAGAALEGNEIMLKKLKQYRQLWLVLPVVLCIGIIVYGGINYISNLRGNLTVQAIENVLAVTRQQQQSFDNYITADRERLRSYADYFSKHDDSGPEAAQELLSLFDDVKAVYAVACLDSRSGGWLTTSMDYDYQMLDEKTREEYRAFENSGVRSSYISLFSETPMFGYYEKFTFPNNGHTGVIQLSYEVETFTEAFSLSFYNGQGLTYVVNRDGDILLRSEGMMGDVLYTNIFEIINGSRANPDDVDRFSASLSSREPGTLSYEGQRGTYIYAYVPMEAVDDWFLVSVVRMEAIAAETNDILMSSRQALMLLAALLVVCVVFGVAIWIINRSIQRRDNEIGYQAALINIFSTYLSRNTDNVFMLLDAETVKMDYVSPNVERVLGLTVDQMVGDVNLFQPKHMIDGPDGPGVYLKSLCGLEPGTEVEDIYLEWINPKTQEQLWMLESTYCTQVQGRKMLVFYISDRTQERKNQDHLTEALEMARAANEAKSAFLGSVSHDIRTPMNAIVGFITLLKDEADNPDVVLEYAGRIETASQHLLSLINDVLDINKIESGSTSLNLVEMNLAEVVDEINAIIRPQAKAKNQSFEISVSPLKYELLQGDKLRLNQILINLLSNSVKYTPAGGRIEMRVEELPQMMPKYSRIRFSVSDNGMGMSEDYLKVIFDPFTREQTEATYEIQGTGLGMAITKSLVDLMGGSIKVTSKLGEGSTFTVELELRIQEQEDDPQFWTDCGLKRMLVADDEEGVCQSIVRLMTQTKTGVEVDYAVSGEGAFDKLCAAREAGHPYDVVLLDWKMPHLNGLDTARLIRERYPENIPVLVLTAYDWSDIEQEAMKVGIRYFMPKPFFMSTFRNVIGRVMGEAGKKEKKDENVDVVRGKHILVVDDIEVNRIILVKILSTLGATCDTANNGQEAADKFNASQPGEYDLILMDVQMPVLDGYGATRAIRAGDHPSAKTVPIIAMTANAFTDDVRDALESGMDAHIAKPVQIDTLKSTIRQVLDSKAE